jgi:hypothetical protein
MKNNGFFQKATLEARLSHPVISAFEFESMKDIKEFQKIIKSSSIYIISQRPLLKIKNITYAENEDSNTHEIHFEIYDKSQNTPLKCFIEFDTKECLENDEVQIRRYYFDREDMLTKSDRNIAAIELLDKYGERVFYLTPQHFFYHHFKNQMASRIIGDYNKFIDYEVHYIGQSFDQEIWQRLTGHEKLQRIMTLERPLDTILPHSPFEISLMLLSVNSLEVASIIDGSGMFEDETKIPIFHNLTDFNRMHDLGKIGREHTNEFEAGLINILKPAYNKILFKGYPFIKSGLRSLGYSESELVITDFPAIIYTKHAVLPAIFTQ